MFYIVKEERPDWIDEQEEEEPAPEGEGEGDAEAEEKPKRTLNEEGTRLTALSLAS